jgi:ABC-2 type transport system ATP-binding protein
MRAISFSHVSKSFSGSPALEDVSLCVKEGEFFGLVGINGAGKTTLLKCLLDFCHFESGSIEIFGVPHREPRAREPLAFLPERFTPPHFLTGQDFINTMRRLYRAHYSANDVADMLDALELERSALSKPVRLLSKGMTQKLGLAGCLLSQRRLYVLDEPTSGLDPKARARFKRSLADLRRAGATVFFTSHSLADVDELADRMAILHAGHMRFSGTPYELRQRFAASTLEQAFLSAISGDS